MWATALSILALVVASTNFLYTQWRTDHREMVKWKREELLRLTSRLLELSQLRMLTLDAQYDRLIGTGGYGLTSEHNLFELTRQMRLVVEQIHLLDDSVAAAAKEVWQLHYESEKDYYPSRDPVADLDQLALNGEVLMAKHLGVIARFRKRVTAPGMLKSLRIGRRVE